FFVSVILHCICYNYITVLGSTNLKMIFLIVIAWIFVFISIKSGLNQVNQIQNEYLEMEGR
ncbi:PrsW family intramembrane metalloprotease, partial [Staphylococcus epidermidis]